MKRFLWVLLLFCFLSGCAREEPAAVLPEPVPVEIPEAAPVVEAPKPVELPAPEFELSPGPKITVNGTDLTALYIDHVCCLRLREFADALGAEPVWEAPAAAFTWQGKTVAVLEDRTDFWVDGERLAFSAPPVTPVEELFVPALELAEGLGLSVVEEGERIWMTPTASSEIPTGYYVPVLMYHGVSDDTWGYSELFVSPSELEKQLQYIQDNGYTTIHFSDLAKVDQIEKPVLLTFDDGYLDNYTELFPILRKYGAKATVFVITGSIDSHPKFMTAAQLREMADSGLVEIQPHTVTHTNLDELTVEEQEWEISQSRLDVLRMTGREPYVFCYPSGRYTRETLELLEGRFAFALRMGGEEYVTDERVLEIDRWYVSRWTDLWAFGDMLDPA